MAATRTMMRYGGRRWFTSCSSRALRWWDHVGPASKDPITGAIEAFLADPSPAKINLGVGAYRDDEGKPVVLQCVREAEAKVAGSDYFCLGSKMVEESVKLVYGEDSFVFREQRFAGIQALSGTGACRLFAELQRRFYPDSEIYLPDLTWSNHHNIWRDAGVSRRTFRYYDPETKGLNFSALLDDIKNAPSGSFFLLHPCAHNPTGVDPTEEQWREISSMFKVKRHFPFFDMAYQGFASGCLVKDALSVRIFLEDGHLIGCAQSFAKNMGLYGHRVGCLSVLANNTVQASMMRSQLQQIARSMYGSPPMHGLLLVSTILTNLEIKALWERELKVMTKRVQTMRTALREELEKLGSSLNWQHVTNQVGMFCFSGLAPNEVERLRKEFHIYMTIDGRLSMAGVTPSNTTYIANAIHQVTRERARM
ncbi:PREDICTED: aspartate aminotransferase, mitochondrial-like isoform X2 [Tarenaya hassleriana]|uniref:aspartate aminotransferase, mitochondrial-like isoform X2 n=1 Tax=Tarenaya hassleriana TaxID=28532 RepID=UPI00053C8C29|nr:PREDICTED: aspartate aminotransferase, mitochondrial-like isoform X2 [Tarenaya hassleriana]